MRFTVAGVLLLLALCGPSLFSQRPEIGSSQEELVYRLYVMRHGVRSPTGEPSQYNRFSSAPWPSWSVPPGYLTAHGYLLVKLLGAYDRQDLRNSGLLTENRCADVDRVFIHADSDQRTRETAQALSEGMFPNCAVNVHAHLEGDNDALFHLSPARFTAAQAQLGAASVLASAGGDPENMAAAYRAPLARLDSLLATCGVSSPRPGRTSLFSIPSTIAPGKGDRIAEMKGPLNTASTLSEILLLEYVEDLPDADVGWGCVDGPKLRELVDLHTTASEILLRNPAVAIPQAAALLQAIASSIQQAGTGQPVDGAEGKPGGRLAILVGHDTNLTNIAGALRLNWLIDGRRNDTPPGSALVFELIRKKSTGRLVVRVSFMTQTLEQMRHSTVLSATQPPPRVKVFLPGCSDGDGSCSLSAFLQVLRTSTGPH